MDPASLKYAKTHEWVHTAGELATIGISDFAVKELTDLVYIDLPSIGTSLEQGDTFGEVESVKAVSDLYAPVSGEVVEVNDTLPDNLQLLSEDPYGAGWVVKVKLSPNTSTDHLLDQSAYAEHCAAESH